MNESAFGVIHKSKGKNARMIANGIRRAKQKAQIEHSPATKVNYTAPSARKTVTVASWPHQPPTPNLNLGAKAKPKRAKRPTKAAYTEAATAKAPGLSTGKLVAITGLGAAGTGGAGYLARKHIFDRNS